MKKLGLSLSILFLIFAAVETFAQGKSGGTVVAEAGDEKIMFEELEKAFKKNMNRQNTSLREVSKDSVMEFLDLYVKYRLKVLDAIDRGFEQDSAVLADIKQNRKILAENFYYDKKLVEPGIENLLKKREHELQIAVMLFVFDNEPEFDTTRAFDKAMTALSRLESGDDFAEIAKELSDDRESAEQGGKIFSYVTSGMIVRDIEDVVYNLKPGEYYPELIPTSSGYFIVKLLKREPRYYVRASHILVEIKKNDSSAAKNKADSLLAELKNGADFAKLAELNSDDPKSAMDGGDLGDYYSRSTGFENTNKRLVPAFEEAMFSLENGEISEPIRTDYGYHIIKRISSKPIDKEKEREELKKIYKRIYYEADKRAYLDSVKKAIGFKIYDDVLNEFLASVDSTKNNLDSAWSDAIPKPLLKRALFKTHKGETSVGQFVEEMNNPRKLRGFALNRRGVVRAINVTTDPVAFEKMTANLEKEYDEFASLMTEFRDAILLYRVEALEVWDNLKFDSTLAKKYWDTTKYRYMTDLKYDVSEIYVLSDSLAKKLYAKIEQGDSFEDLAEYYTQRDGYREKRGSWGAVSIESNRLAKHAKEMNAKPGDALEPFANGQGFSIVKLNAVLKPREKTFEEAIPDFAPQFQELMQKTLTENWLSEVRKRHPVKIYEERIDKLLKK